MSAQLWTLPLLAVASTVACGAATLFGTYMLKPAAMLDLYVYILKTRSGLKSQFVDVKAPDSEECKDDPKFRWHYLDSDPNNLKKKPVLVFIHGFSSASDSMCRLAYDAVKDFRVIVPDLTGHGETRPLDSSACYDIPVQANRLIAFINKVIGESEPFHLLGTSMGGWLSAEVAIRLSSTKVPASKVSPDAKDGEKTDRLRSLSLLCPAGINAEEATEKQLEDFHSARVKLLPKTVDDLLAMFKMISARPRSLPTRIMEAYMKRRARHYDIYERLMQDMLAEGHKCHLKPERLSKISCRSLVIWGAEDQLLSPDALAIFERDIPRVEAHMLSDCGHAILMDKLGDLKTLVLEFVRRDLN